MTLNLEIDQEQCHSSFQPKWVNMLQQLLIISGEIEQVEHGEVSLSFVGDERIHELNKTYRGIDRPTDVLSFAMNDSSDDELIIHFEQGSDDEEDFASEDNPSSANMLGDIVISVPRAILQSEEYGHSIEREIAFLFVHGFLHLLGYDHHTEEEEKTMFQKQEDILERAGITR